MICSLNDLKCKEVINVETGEKIGFIDDIEFEPENGTVIAFIIYGRMRFWGIFGKEDDIILTCQTYRERYDTCKINRQFLCKIIHKKK